MEVAKPKCTPQTADQRMYMVPLKEIFGRPQDQLEFIPHRQVVPAHQKETCRADGYSSNPGGLSISITYNLPANKLAIPVIEQTDVSPEKLDSTTTLQFSIYYDVQHSVLNVHLLKATNLPIASASGMNQGVFLRIHIASRKDRVFESMLVTKSKLAVFNEVFELSNVRPEMVCTEKLVFQIYESGRAFVGRFIGSVVLPLGEADLFGVITTMRIDETGANLPVSHDHCIL